MPYKAAHALSLLTRAQSLGRLAHAYLITGPREVDLLAFSLEVLRLVTGKKRYQFDDFKREGAYVLNPEGKTRRIIVGDLQNPDPNTMRHFMHHFQMCSDNQMKIGVITDADRMNDAAQNAFLRTLEEPPENTLFLILTHNPKALLATTRSRVIEIPLMPPEGVRIFSPAEEKLLAVLAQIAGRAGSGMGLALGIKTEFQAILEEMRDDIEKQHESAFEKEQDHYGKTTDGVWLKQREDQVAAAVQAEYLGQRDALIDLLLAWMGDVARQQVGATHLDLPSYQHATARLAEQWQAEETAKRLRALRQLEQHLHTNVNEGLALEVAFIQAFGR